MCSSELKGVSNCAFYSPLTSTKVLTSNSSLHQFYNGGGRGGKREVCRERPCRQDEQTGPVFVPVFVVSWSPQLGEREERVNSGLASDPLSLGSLCQITNIKTKVLWFVWRI